MNTTPTPKRPSGHVGERGESDQEGDPKATTLLAPALPRPEPLECLLRSLLLVPLIGLSFALGAEQLNSKPVDEFYVFASLVGLMATPVGFVERWLHGSSRGVKISSGCWLPLVLGVLSVFLIAQTTFAVAVFEGQPQDQAFQAAFTVITRVPKDQAIAFLLPLTFPFVGATLLRWARVRRRWLLLLLPLGSLPATWLLGRLLSVRDEREFTVFGLIVLVSSITLPMANAGAEDLARRWRRRREAS